MDTPEKLDLGSMDIAAAQQAKLRELFPEAFTEGGKIDLERLKASLGEAVDPGKERYGLNWPGKANCFKTIQRPSMATLIPARDESVNFDTTENLIIEGDNLEVLKLLQKSYLGQVKMISIDPPYNTGNDFIYPDNFSESLETYLQYTGQVDAEGRKFSTNPESDGRFHSKWLNMMYPRLFLARNLLREDGVIFITIDDAEFDNLKKIGCEVFGEENFVGSVIWQHSIQPKGYTGKFSVHHNFILCFRKSDTFELANLDRTDEHNKNYSNPDNDPKGLWRSGDVRNALYRPNLIYDIPTPSGKSIPPPPNGWRWQKETVQKKIATGEIKFSADETRIIRKIYLQDLDGRTPETIWFGKDVGTTRDAAGELKELFDGNSPFDTPKPTLLLRHMLQLGTTSEDDDIVLDFFAGSATTAHAVLDQNTEDGGKRRFILVQLPEPVERKDFRTIADISKERVRRAIKKLNERDGGQLALENKPKPDRGFKVFKLQGSNFKAWNAAQPKDAEQLGKQLEMHVQHIETGRTQEDILFEILLKSGFPLATRIETVKLAGQTVFSIAEGAMLICLEKELTEAVIKEMATRKPERIVCLDAGFAGNDQLKTNAAQTFKAKGVTSFRTV